MKASSILGWRYLVSKIHPQLPLNPRESEKLLSLLKISFRQQLDREHPVALSASRYATDNHLQSILKSPLFEAEPKKRRSSSLDQRHGSQLGRVQELLERPMEYFRNQVIVGTANLETAKVCLTAQYEKLSSGPASKTMNKFSDTGSIVLSWLWSSGLAESKSFLQDKRFFDLIAPFLVIEGHGDLIWRWLVQLQPAIDRASPRNISTRRRYMFYKMIESEAKYGAGVTFSVDTFMQKSNEVRLSPRALNYISEGLFDQAGTYLCMELARASGSNTIAADMYDRFLQTVASWSPRPLYHRGLMELYHLQNPITTSAIHYLKQWMPVQSDRRGTVRLGLKAAEVLLHKEAQTDALWVIDFLKTNFAKELGIPSATGDFGERLSREQKSTKQVEEVSLRSLEALEAH